MKERIIKALLFDLDGTLLDCKNIHYKALNQALKQHDIKPISKEEHEKIFDGLSTKEKIKKLTNKNGEKLSKEQQKSINELKQKLSIKEFKKLRPKQFLKLKNLINDLSKYYKIGIVSNARQETVITAINKIGINPDIIISNEDVKRIKPFSEPYITALHCLKLRPKDAMVFEDNHYGITSARSAGIPLINKTNPKDILTILEIMKEIHQKKS